MMGDYEANMKQKTAQMAASQAALKQEQGGTIAQPPGQTFAKEHRSVIRMTRISPSCQAAKAP